MIWKLDGSTMGSCPIEAQWNSHESNGSETPPWKHKGGTMEAPRMSHGNTVDVPWKPHGNTVNIPWNHHAGTMEVDVLSLFFFVSLLLSRFWTSCGLRFPPFSPPVRSFSFCHA